MLASAIAHLPTGNKPGPGGSVVLTSADARLALGLSGFTGCYNSSGTFIGGCGQIYDGVITLSTSQTLNYASTPVSGAYSVINTIEHEINEILGGGGQGTILNQICARQHPLQQRCRACWIFIAMPRRVWRASAHPAPCRRISRSMAGPTAIAGFNQSSTGDLADFSTSGTDTVGDLEPWDRGCPTTRLSPGVRDAGVDRYMPAP